MSRRRSNESRTAWRARIRSSQPIRARLVAARIPKAFVVAGWTEAVHLRGTPNERPRGSKRVHRAVPAGAVYYFEADTVDESNKLAAALNWHGGERDATTVQNRRSTLLGEKGYGLGVCGEWTFLEDDGGRSIEPPANP